MGSGSTNEASDEATSLGTRGGVVVRTEADDGAGIFIPGICCALTRCVLQSRPKAEAFLRKERRLPDER